MSGCGKVSGDGKGPRIQEAQETRVAPKTVVPVVPRTLMAAISPVAPIS